MPPATYYQDEHVTLYHGDCLEELKRLDDNSVDAVITDPPYGLSNTKPAQVADVLAAWVNGNTAAVPAKRGGFMGKDWDSFVPPPAVWQECLRVLKPGGHMAVFAGSRTQDLMGLSIRLAGFEIRDTLGWIYGSGFPKSHNVSKAIDRAAGKLQPESTGFTVAGYSHNPEGLQHTAPSKGYVPPAPVTPEAKQWSGWGTALKPAIEPIILARKPLDGTAAANVLEHGVGGLNIDASRVQSADPLVRPDIRRDDNAVFGSGLGSGVQEEPAGRFPANVLLDEHAAAEMDKQSGAGGASRFFPVFKYQAKASKKERPVIVRDDGTKVQHPTVKPLALMEWLCNLIAPPEGVILDPFAGTGTTLQAATNTGHRSIGVEADSDYVQLIRQRLQNNEQPPHQETLNF